MAEPSREQVWKMFDRISPSYDRVNRVLSFGLDLLWRAKLSRYLPSGKPLVLIDLATGTGDQLLSLFKRTSSIKKAVGIDLAEQMLEIARKKLQKSSHKNSTEFLCQDIQNTTFDDHSFDCATLAFGIRNVTDVPTALSEIHRILAPKGRALILEFSMPKNPIVKPVYQSYLRYLLPTIGGLFSKDKGAYSYLNKTIETFPSRNDFCDLLRKSGFSNAEYVSLSFGAVTLYVADKS